MRTTVGLLPMDGIAPLSPSIDTAGPIVKSVRDAALVLSVLAGDKLDNPRSSSGNGLTGARIGVIKRPYGPSAPPAAVKVYSPLLKKAADAMRRSGATVVHDIEVELHLPWKDYSGPGIVSHNAGEFRDALPAYLATLHECVHAHCRTHTPAIPRASRLCMISTIMTSSTALISQVEPNA